MKILGIDESGRGPVCGPMVLCGYLIDEGKVPELKKIGVKDSKLLSHTKRKELYPLLSDMSEDFVTVTVSAEEIDKLRTETNLNKLEIDRMQAIINVLRPDKVIIDSPEVNTKNFSKKIAAGLTVETEIVAENYADKNHPEVGAASIIAKVERDAEISELHRKYGCFGSGYSSDEITIRFLKDWIKKNKEFPDFVRKSWFTASRLAAEKEQTKLGKFVG